MKIVYWSPYHGQAGTTSNMLINGVLSSILYKQKSILTHTHFTLNNLELPLVGSNAKNIDSRGYFQDVGIDALIRNYKSAILTQEDLYNCCISIPNTSLSLLPGTSKNNEVSFEYEMNKVLINILKSIEGMSDIVFIDVCSGNNPISLKIIEDSDITIVNLSQNQEVIYSYFSTYKDIHHGKQFYLLGNYDANSRYNLSNIRRRYHKFIKPNNSGVIPHNTGFLDSLNDGKVVEFIRDNISADRDDENYYFMSMAMEVSEKINNLIGIAVDSKEK
ncbi:MAG: hypothetical protein GX915_02845 [Clostridiales bacterium]|nr:hypothetical protein [Clostridiales bacterium]